MGVIPVSFDRLRANYPMRPDLTPELTKFMGTIVGTPCCVQVSHALNLSGELVSQRYGGRRWNSPIVVNGKTLYYLLAVDEMEAWLTQKYPSGELVSVDENQKRRSPQQIKNYLQGRTGILVFREGQYGFHTELWNGQRFHQTDMDDLACLSKDRVLFWDCWGPQWLQDYMAKQV